MKIIYPHPGTAKLVKWAFYDCVKQVKYLVLPALRMGGADVGVKPPFDCSLVSPKSITGLGLGTYSLRGCD